MFAKLHATAHRYFHIVSAAVAMSFHVVGTTLVATIFVPCVAAEHVVVATRRAGVAAIYRTCRDVRTMFGRIVADVRHLFT